ncbi:MAG: 23S rRNA (guanosine(2251)-2'-O)-methyltransferase RlmB [Neisseriaceae bacterium]
MDIIFGFHSVTSYINNFVNNINKIYVDNKRHDKRLEHILTLCRQNNIEVVSVDTKVLDKLSCGNKHQGIIAELEAQSVIKEQSLTEFLESTTNKIDSIVLILDGITDPHNLGAIIRTAECFGVDTIILPKDNSANTKNTTVLTTSSGAINNIGIITVTNINRTIDKLKESGYWITGTTLNNRSTSLFDTNFNKKVAIVMGSEERGIRRLVEENCDFLIKIPMFGKTQSLNVSVATGVILSHIRFIQNKA